MFLAIIGLGGIAHRIYLPLLAGWDGLDLLLCTRRDEVLHQLQVQYRIPQGTTDLDEVIRRKPQAAVVLTSTETHAEIARRLLEGGIDVYLEKPATLQAMETRSLAELADRLNRVLMVGFNRRFAPLHVRARELLGDLPLSLAVFSKHRREPPSPDLFGQLIDDTIHQVDALRYYCGEGEVLSASWVERSGKLSALTCTVRFERSGLGVITSSLESGGWKEEYDLHAAGQFIRVEAFESLKLVNSSGEKEWREGYASRYVTTLEGRGFAGEIAHFIDCVNSRSLPQTSAWDSVKTQELVEEIVERAGRR